MADYKNTLNLPNTKFPMRGNLSKQEPNALLRWHNHSLYEIIRKAKKGKKIFVLHDGPPYANGNIHIGHSINKILKDIIIKSKGFTGYDAPYIPGWDCHGLPIELKVEQIIGKLNKKVSAAEFRTICRNYASRQIEKQKKDFIRLGVLGDWNNPYLTMTFATEANIIRVLGKIIANGHLYRDSKPIHWCISCCSTLAEAEMEYYDYISLSIDVAFKAKNALLVAAKFGILNFTGQIFLAIWTTTPWTLPANRAIAIHPDFNYQLIEVNGQGYIFAKDLVKSVMLRARIMQWTVLGTAKGSELELLLFHHPFMELIVPVICSRHVLADSGTGAVHIAPGHGPDDYILGKEYGLEVANLVGPDGYYLSGTLSILDGIQVFEANDVVIGILNKNKALMSVEKIKHSYPHCWRHKTPIIFRAIPQWFISMDQCGLRKKILDEIKKIQWIPSCGKARIQNMIANRPDWCISRQRTWGVSIALFLHNETKALHPRTIELIEIVAKRVEKHGIQAWWDLDPNEILGKDAPYYHKVLDTLDVWFDSGSTHSSVVAVRPEFRGHSPDMYIEGSDQHRGWFMSSLIISTAMYGKVMHNQVVVTHGFVVDGDGKKMSKSIGNVISPQQIINQFGADVLRLWVASTDYIGDVTVSNEIIKRSASTYRRIRNTARFLLSNLNDFVPARHSVSANQMLVIDQWAVDRAQEAQVEIISAYNSYNFHNAVQRIMYFCSVEMGSFYLDVIKDRQYTNKVDSISRRSCQTALYHIIEAMVRWIAPIMSFTADEIWGFIPGERAQYVFTEEWYTGLFRLDPLERLNNNYWQILLKIRNETNKAIEQARVDKRINGSSLDASVILYAENELLASLKELGNELCFVLLTSSAIIKNYADASNDSVQCESLQGLKIKVIEAIGKKCMRCWHYETNIGQHADYPEICARCVINLIGYGEERKFV